MNYYTDPKDVKPVSTTTAEAPPLATIPEQIKGNQQAALSQNILNLRNAFTDAVATVKVATAERDSSQNARYRYERNYQRMLAAAKNLILASGATLEVPTYLAPPARKDQVDTLGPESFPTAPDDDSAIRARKAAEAAANVRPGVPGGDSHEAWLAYQGVKK